MENISNKQQANKNESMMENNPETPSVSDDTHLDKHEPTDSISHANNSKATEANNATDDSTSEEIENSLESIDEEIKNVGEQNLPEHSPTKPIDLDTEPRLQKLMARRSESFSGPIPPPELLHGYNQVIPNGADRIMTMAESQQAHRQFLEKSVVESDIRRSDRGLILGFIITILFGIGGMLLIAIGQDLNGLAVIFVPLAGLVGTFIYSQRYRKQERIEKSKNISEQKDADS